MKEEEFKKEQPQTVSYEAKKRVEQDLSDLEDKAKRDVSASKHKEKFLSEKNKVYCKPCKYRKMNSCTNKEVLVYYGKFSSDALDCDTEQKMSIYEANASNDCQFFEAKEVTDLKAFLKKFLIFIFIGSSLLIGGLIWLIYFIAQSLTI